MSVTGLQTEGLKYAKAIFDTVRRMSADTLGVSRQGYSELETDVLHYLQGLGRDIGLEVRADDAGNVWMTMPGRDRTLPAFVAGSHVDSVPQGGNYDGLAGVTAALTVAWWMHRHQVQLERDYTVLMMRCEEGLRGLARHDGPPDAVRPDAAPPHGGHHARPVHLGLRP